MAVINRARVVGTPPVAPKPQASPNSFSGGDVSGTPGPDSDVVAPTIQPPPAPPGPTPADATSEFGKLNAEALEAALKSIETQFGLTREQLLADQSAIGQEYQLLFAQSQQAREGQIEQVGFEGQERGITRSGIQAENVADTISAFDREVEQLELQRSTQTESINSQLALLQAQEESARLEAERAAKQAALDNEVLEALAAAGA